MFLLFLPPGVTLPIPSLVFWTFFNPGVFTRAMVVVVADGDPHLPHDIFISVRNMRTAVEFMRQMVETLQAHGFLIHTKEPHGTLMGLDKDQYTAGKCSQRKSSRPSDCWL